MLNKEPYGHCVFSDPAAENFNYPVSIDVRELISLQDVMEELDLGPNGCVKYKNIKY